MDELRRCQPRHDRLHPTRCIQILETMRAGGAEAADMGHMGADLVEALQAELDLCLPGNGMHMEDGVR